MNFPPPDKNDPACDLKTTPWDYIVVGSGAGGAPLAARLARGGRTVLVLEAGGPAADSMAGHSRVTEQVPGYHAASTEDPAISWHMWCRHHKNPQIDAADSKFHPLQKKKFYPRASGLGGCTAHNAMITHYGHDSDWQYLADLTGDASWAPSTMRGYFKRLENCRYRGEWPEGWKRNRLVEWWRGLWNILQPEDTPNGGRHGFDGWLHTSLSNPRLVLDDKEGGLLRIILKALETVLEDGIVKPQAALKAALSNRLLARLDPNDAETLRLQPEGPCLIPLAIRQGQRSGPREWLLQTLRDCPGRLRICTHTFVKRLIYKEHAGVVTSPVTVIGVEVQTGGQFYQASPVALPSDSGETRQLFARREVILCGGAFNTPQIMLLSGLGPKDEVKRGGHPLVAALPAVGRYLQDRYEVSVVSRKECAWEILDKVTFDPGDQTGDPQWQRWHGQKAGLYSTNGGLIALTVKSSPRLPDPDLFIFALPAFFAGYYEGWSRDVVRRRDVLTWVILKAHARDGLVDDDQYGTVTLNAQTPADATAPPEIEFNSFPGREADPDLIALEYGVDLVRRINTKLSGFSPEETEPQDLARIPRAGVHSGQWIERQPGPMEQPGELKRWIRREAWGHHACGTCRIGRDAKDSVVDSRFRVHGVQGLRIVDASIFPRIPGMFIVTPLYMASEKAADTILNEKTTHPLP